MSEYLPGLDLPEHRQGSMPSNGAYQCPVCQGIAYNPVCPYCEDDSPDDDVSGAVRPTFQLPRAS